MVNVRELFFTGVKIAGAASGIITITSCQPMVENPVLATQTIASPVKPTDVPSPLLSPVNTETPTRQPTRIFPSPPPRPSDAPTPVPTPTETLPSPEEVLNAGNVLIIGTSSAEQAGQMLLANPELCQQIFTLAKQCEVHNGHGGQTFADLKNWAAKNDFTPTKFKAPNTIVLITGGNNGIMDLQLANLMTEAQKQQAINQLGNDGIDFTELVVAQNLDANTILILPTHSPVDLEKPFLPEIRLGVNEKLVKGLSPDPAVFTYNADKLATDFKDQKHYTDTTLQRILRESFLASAQKFYERNLRRFLDNKVKTH